PGPARAGPWVTEDSPLGPPSRLPGPLPAHRPSVAVLHAFAARDLVRIAELELERRSKPTAAAWTDSSSTRRLGRPVRLHGVRGYTGLRNAIGIPWGVATGVARGGRMLGGPPSPPHRPPGRPTPDPLHPPA